MVSLKSTWLALLGGALLAATPALAQDSGPLLDLLVKKGVVTDQEAEDLRAELARDFASNSPAGKLDLSTRVQRFALAGDVRVRYQYDNEVANNFDSAPSTGPNNDRSRYRYRIRFGPTVQLANNWIAGFRLETAAGSTSTNDDFGAAGSANFAKDGNTAFVGQAWIQYQATNKWGFDRVDLRLGKHAHTYFTPGVNGFLVDTDINFEGISEDFGFNNVGGYALTLRGGQYLLANNSRTTDRFGSFLNQPTIMWAGQAEFSKTTIFENNPYGLRVAPGVFAFTGPEASNPTGAATAPAGGLYNTDIWHYDNFVAVFLPAEYVIRVANRPLGFYATYGINLKGGDRANWLYSANALGSEPVLTTAAGNPASYNQFGNVGVRFGATRNPGDWLLTGEYRYIEPGAYTAILLDSDFNAGRPNGQGFIFSGSYNITDAVTATVTFFHSENIDKNSGGAMGFHRADVLQVDLSARF